MKKSVILNSNFSFNIQRCLLQKKSGALESLTQFGLLGLYFGKLLIDERVVFLNLICQLCACVGWNGEIVRKVIGE